MKNKLITVLKNLDLVVAAGLFIVTLVIVAVNVFTRYILNFVITTGEEIATTCFVYTVFIGAAWCLRTHQHVGVDLLVDHFPFLARKTIRLITDFIIFILNGYITYLSVQYIYSSRIKTMPLLKISSVWLNSALFVGFGLMTVYSVANIVHDITHFKDPDEEEVES